MAGHLERVDQACQRNGPRALDVVIVAADLVAVAGEQSDRVCAGPILEMEAAIRENFLNRIHELVDESVQLLGRRAMAAQADVEWIMETVFVVRSGIQV